MDTTELEQSVSIHPECCTQAAPSLTLSTQIYLRQINRELEWRTLTQSWLVVCLLYSLATNWPICQSAGVMIFMCLRLCIVYHLCSSNHCSCLSFTIIVPLGSLPVSFSIPTPSRIIFPCHRQTIKPTPPLSPSPHPPPLLPALDLNLMSPLHFPSASNNIQNRCGS